VPESVEKEEAARVVALVGATATGKTELAIELAQRLGGEILNADALQAYRGLDIGTAKPSPAERARVPHHLFDILDPREPYSAGDFARRADAVLADLRRRGRPAIVVGGSGLYQRALFFGLASLPPVDLELRETLRREATERGTPALHAELAALDPVTAARLAPGDTQRVLRALEVLRNSGRPLSEWLREASKRPRFPFVRIGLTLPRRLLYDRLASRVVAMVERGWVEEVAGLLEQGVPAEAPGFQAIGYRQLVGHLRGESSLAAAVSDIVASTRRYAKRQETWFRKEEGVRWLEATGAAERLVEGVLRELPPNWVPR
jgi:tRNA dimethylallyltransferase